MENGVYRIKHTDHLKEFAIPESDRVRLDFFNDRERFKILHEQLEQSKQYAEATTAVRQRKSAELRIPRPHPGSGRRTQSAKATSGRAYNEDDDEGSWRSHAVNNVRGLQRIMTNNKVDEGRSSQPSDKAILDSALSGTNSATALVSSQRCNVVLLLIFDTHSEAAY